MKTARTLAIAAGTFVVCMSLFCVLVWWVSNREVRRAGQLLHELGQLELGPSMAGSARAFVRRYGLSRVPYAPLAMDNCRDGDESYQVSVRPSLADRISRRVPWLAGIGLIPFWQIDAAVQFHNGEVECAGEFVYFPHAHAAAIFSGVMRPRGSYDTAEKYEVVFATPQELLSVSSLPGADSAQKASALEPDLSCLRWLPGCRYPCELSPSAWRFYQTTAEWQHLVLGWGRPPDADDPLCKGNDT
jgi:hypothetical protein